MKNIITVAFFSIFLTACSPADIFSQLATSDVEQAAGEVIESQNKKQQKLDIIEAKKSAFPKSTLLTVQNETDTYQAIAFLNVFSVDQKSILDIEAILPDPQGLTYITWHKSPQDKIFQKIGSLARKDVDDYIFTYETQEDLTPLSQIAISLDKPSVEKPGNIILVGEFSSD